MNMTTGAGTSGTSVFQNGSSGWLSDAQLEFALSIQSAARIALPSATDVSAGQQIPVESTLYRVTTVTQALYAGVEGELPFEYWDKTVCTFADLGTTEAKFGTIDYSNRRHCCSPASRLLR